MNDFMESPPDRLCLKCGKCCKLVTAKISHTELLKKVEANDKEALAFIDMFVPYSSSEDAKKVCLASYEKLLTEAENEQEQVTFYYCKYVTADNLCAIYQDRPSGCRVYPSNCFISLPSGCGYEGWRFSQQEVFKNKIRVLKEYILELNAEISCCDDASKKEQILNKVAEIKEFIDSFSKYGSQDW